jgi:AcrR family transcriptional regulator
MPKNNLTTKEMILQTSSEYFSKYGFELTYLDDIATKCGISKPAIYYYFKDKTELYQTVLIEKNTNKNTPIENLQSYMHIYIGF